MIKKLLLSLLILTCGVAFAAAADAPKAAPDTSTAKVTAVTGNLVKIEVSGDLAAWMKKGAYVRAVTAAGGTLALRGAKITVIEGNTVTVQTAMAKDMKVGATYLVSKGKPSAGC